MTSSIPTLALPAFALLVGACSAFYPPKEEDDGVARCDNVGDCDVPDNSRWDVECVHGVDQDEATDKVCAPVFRSVSCDPMKYGAEHPLRVKWEEAQNAPAGVYVSCDEMTQAGTLGCKPRPAGDPMGRCNDNMVINVFGVCDVADAEFPAAPARPDLAGVDVLDQFCRSYFCDEAWVCDSSTSAPVCQPCKEPKEGATDEIGQGYCAELHTKVTDGSVKPSTVYVSDVSCGENGLSSDATTAARLAGEAIGPIPDGT